MTTRRALLIGLILATPEILAYLLLELQRAWVRAQMRYQRRTP